MHMTGLNDTRTQHDQLARDFHRERLSAMMDGTLSADEARFLLRRVEHDDELADCWQRWQFYGDAMRGHAGRALPADFAQRVGRAIAEDASDAQRETDAVPSPSRRPFAYWRGVAIAASVALVALAGSRFAMPEHQAPAVASNPAPPPAPVAVAAERASLPASPQPSGSAPAVAQAASAALVAAAVGGESRKRHFVAASRAVGESPNALASAAQATERAQPPIEVVLADAPRHQDSAATQSKPWPKALVPGTSGSDAIVDLRIDGGAPAPARQSRFAPFGPADSAAAAASQR